MSSARAVCLELRRFMSASDVLNRIASACPHPDRLRAQRAQLERAIAEGIDRMRASIGDARCPPLLSDGHASLAAACGLGADSDVKAHRAAVMLETAYSTLLLELFWMAVAGEAAAATSVTTGKAGPD